MLQSDEAVTALTGLRNDRTVGLCGGFFRLQPCEGVVEGLCAEDDRQRIGVAALLVDRTEPVGQVTLGDREDLPRDRELAPGLGGLAVDRAGPRAQRRQFGLRAREPAVECVER